MGDLTGKEQKIQYLQEHCGILGEKLRQEDKTCPLENHAV